ncbi:hypothetical protein MBSD_n0614 [Mizugakiibacter sediminis]|uniref:Uncharacterized protein n=1 Tax=Mizugakiibacter sediminis TaxID=1475481 RepID=A0A0K8QK57_9GAMM|nr:hypothetical protein MBSD_n0614 [Mizugakiibacter sediminis]
MRGSLAARAPARGNRSRMLHPHLHPRHGPSKVLPRVHARPYGAPDCPGTVTTHQGKNQECHA